MPEISGRTRIVAIIGDPVAHSLSPAIHNAAFRALDLDFVYIALRVAPANLRKAVAGVRSLGFAGLNVTVPHKERILPLLDELTPAARAIGAVNCVVHRSGRLIGDNTDAAGFQMALADCGFSVRRRHVLVLGAGGSARAVLWTVARGKAQRITILNRTPERARSLARFARALGASHVTSGPLAEASRPDVVSTVNLVVNCTPSGLDGRSMPPLPLRELPPDAAIYDLVYGHSTTPLVSAARKSGRRAHDGRKMLLHQAALGFRQWTGKKAPLARMAEVLEA